MFTLTLLLWVAAFALSIVLQPKPSTENARPAASGDFNFPTATQGRVIPVVWGTVLLNAPNVVWYGDIFSVPNTTHIKSGLFSSSQVILSYRYYASIQMGLCLGPIDFYKTIYIGDYVVFSGVQGEGDIQLNFPNLYGGNTPPGNGGVIGEVDLYLGTTTQNVDPNLGAAQPAYIWFDDFTQGQVNQPLQEFEGTDPNAYYSVADNGFQGLPFGNSPITQTQMVTASNLYTSESLSPAIHIRSNVVIGSNPYLNHNLVGILQHPSRPHLSDQISMTVVMEGRGDTGSVDIGGEVGFGCKIDDDLAGVVNNYGVFFMYAAGNYTIYATGPSGTVTIGSAAVDLYTFALNTVEMDVQGALVTIKINGSLFATYTDATGTILSIPGTNGGFSLLIGQSLNSLQNNSQDLSSVGIYSLGINDLNRQFTAVTPAFRGLAYALAWSFYLGNSSQIQPWAFEVRRCPNNLGISPENIVNTDANGVGTDANPMEVIYEILTNTVWGLGQSPSLINIPNFQAAANTLFNEGNGVSMVIDNTIQCSDLLTEIERQIDGFVFVNRNTGLWECTLVRAGYSINNVPSINESNTIRVKSYTQGAWEDTTNQVNVRFSAREDSYQEAYGLAQDMANVMIQGGTVISVEEKYSGVKDQTLANNIAWRDLRALCVPMSKATVEVDRTFYLSNPGDVVAFTNTSLGVINRAMRVIRVDLGKSDDQTMVLDLAQDVFGFFAPSYASPTSTMWSNPSNLLPNPITVQNSLVFEAPYKFDQLAVVSPGALDRIWVGAEYPDDGSSQIEIWSDPYTSTNFQQVGDVQGFLTRTVLSSTINYPSTAGGDTVSTGMSVDTIATVLASLTTATSTQIGVGLFNISLVDQEIFAYTGFNSTASTVEYTGVFRGLCDTVPTTHNQNAQVWNMSVAGNVTDLTFSQNTQYSIKLRNINQNGPLPIGNSPNNFITMNNRAESPYPPTNLSLNGSLWPQNVSVDTVNLSLVGESMFNNTSMIQNPIYTDGSNFNLGMIFSTDTVGTVSAVRFYKGGPANGGTHIGYLFNQATGAMLGSTVFTNETSMGWQQSAFNPPIAVAVGSTYTIAVNEPQGHYPFLTTPFPSTIGDLYFSTGVFGVGGTAMPAEGINQSYYVDLLFVPSNVSNDTRGIILSYTRRDYRNTNEILAMLNENTLPADFPANNSTKYQAAPYYISTASNLLLYSTQQTSTNTLFIPRNWWIVTSNQQGSTTASTINLAISTSHIFSGSTFQSLQQLGVTNFPVLTSLSTEQYLGATAFAVTTSTYTVPGTGSTFTATIGTVLPGGAVVQGEFNGGGAINVIPSGASTSTFTASTGTTIKFLHTSNTSNGSTTFFSLFQNATSTQTAYAIFTY